MNSRILSLYLILLNLFSHAQVSKTSAKLNFLLEEQGNKRVFLLIKADSSYVKALSRLHNFTYRYASGDISSIEIEKNKIPLLIQDPKIKYIEYNPVTYEVLADTMLIRNKIKPVKQGQSPLPQGYDGSGVIMGIIDSGIDFTHPDFKNPNGTTRILYLWDQTIPSGTYSPFPYNYGREWTAAQINGSLCTHSDAPYWGHGTHVSGIAAGNAQANGTHEGVASKSELIVVALNFTSTATTIADAVQYIFSKANALNKPCVINASVGNYYGSHDATDLQSKIIESQLQAQPGRVVVGAAGNAGNIKYHCKTQTTSLSDTLFTWLKSGNGSFGYWFYADTQDVKNIRYTFGCNRPNYTNIGTIPACSYTYALNSIKTDTLKNANNKRIGYIKQSASINADGVYELFAIIYQDSTQYLWRIESWGNALHDAWNFNFQSSNLPSVSQYWRMNKYRMPDTMSTLVSGFQCSPHVITVGNYINKKSWYDVNNNLQTENVTPGAISQNSSSGPTRKGLLKPDVAASGAYIFSCMALTLATAFNPTQVALGGYHVQGGGTSAASPVVAGLAALYLQKNPSATHLQVKNAITSCTYSDNFTGTLPNMLFGHGKLDGFAAMLCSTATAVHDETLSPTPNPSVFPNPFNDKFQINGLTGNINTIELFDITGRLMYSIQTEKNECFIPRGNMPGGMYILKISNEKRNYSAKILAD
jgi:subtilisin family serine protease